MPSPTRDSAPAAQAATLSLDVVQLLLEVVLQVELGRVHLRHIAQEEQRHRALLRVLVLVALRRPLEVLELFDQGIRHQPALPEHHSARILMERYLCDRRAGR